MPGLREKHSGIIARRPEGTTSGPIRQVRRTERAGPCHQGKQRGEDTKRGGNEGVQCWTEIMAWRFPRRRFFPTAGGSSPRCRLDRAVRLGPLHVGPPDAKANCRQQNRQPKNAKGPHCAAPPASPIGLNGPSQRKNPQWPLKQSPRRLESDRIRSAQLLVRE